MRSGNAGIPSHSPPISATGRFPLTCSGTDRCAGNVVIGRNYNFDQPERVLREFKDTIFGQDQVVVESQRPERAPFDLTDEPHLKFDAVAVAYRKAMRALGLAAGEPG
jgi:hypothetical protein